MLINFLENYLGMIIGFTMGNFIWCYFSKDGWEKELYLSFAQAVAILTCWFVNGRG